MILHITYKHSHDSVYNGCSGLHLTPHSCIRMVGHEGSIEWYLSSNHPSISARKATQKETRLYNLHKKLKRI